MKQLRVIGVGSPYERDDQAWQVIDFLRLQFRGNDYEFIKLDRPGSQLIAYLEDADRVVVMDSLEQTPVQAREQSVILLEVDQLQEENILFSSHAFGVAESLQLAKAMQLLPNELHILGLSPTAGIVALADRCAAIINDILSGEQGRVQDADAV